MTRATNREIERYYFEQLRAHFDLPAGSIVYADKPDVRIVGQRVIGIEIARLYLKDGADAASEQRQARLREKVLTSAQDLYRAAGGRDIELHVDFDPSRPITSVDDAAKKLAVFAHEIEHSPAMYAGDLTGNAAGLRYVYHNGVEYQNPQWRNLQVFTTSPLDVARLVTVVEEKTKKAEGYHPCDESWLLLVVDFMDRAQDQALVLPPEFALPPSAFDRVLVYKPQFREVLQVPQ